MYIASPSMILIRCLSIDIRNINISRADNPLVSDHGVLYRQQPYGFSIFSPTLNHHNFSNQFEFCRQNFPKRLSECFKYGKFFK